MITTSSTTFEGRQDKPTKCRTFSKGYSVYPYQSITPQITPTGLFCCKLRPWHAKTTCFDNKILPVIYNMYVDIYFYRCILKSELLYPNIFRGRVIAPLEPTLVREVFLYQMHASNRTLHTLSRIQYISIACKIHSRVIGIGSPTSNNIR